MATSVRTEKLFEAGHPLHRGWLGNGTKEQKDARKRGKESCFLPGSESELPVGDWHKLEGIKILFLGTVAGKKQASKKERIRWEHKTFS